MALYKSGSIIWNLVTSFAIDIHKRFDLNDDALSGGNLNKIMQTSTVANYQTKYETQATKMVGSPEWFLLELFISGFDDGWFDHPS